MVTPILTKNLFKSSNLLSHPKTKNFTLTINSGAPDTSVAYGPGSIIHGSVSLQLPQSTQAYCVRVIFRCDERHGKIRQRSNTRASIDNGSRNSGSNNEDTLFEVESIVWGRRKEGNEWAVYHVAGGPWGGECKAVLWNYAIACQGVITGIVSTCSHPSSSFYLVQDTKELTAGRHMFLFAVKIPMVNYPPTLQDPSVDHKVIYTLQGFLDLPSATQPASPRYHTEHTAPQIITFLPLIHCSSTPPPSHREISRTSSGEPLVDVNAELGRAGHCPGETCTVKISAINKSDNKISSIHIALVANIEIIAAPPPQATTFPLTNVLTSTSLPPLPTKHRSQTLLSETFHTVIPRGALTPQTSTIRFRLPPTMLPSISTDICRSVDIRYDVVVSIPLTSSSSSSSSFWRVANPSPSTSSSYTASTNPSSTSSTTTSKPHTLTITLPLIIGTIPANRTSLTTQIVPSFLENPELPSFAKSDSTYPDSAPASPTSPISPWPESPMDERSTSVTPTDSLSSSEDRNPYEATLATGSGDPENSQDEQDPDLRVPSKRDSLMRLDASGHLLPPTKGRHPLIRRASSGSGSGSSGGLSGTDGVATGVVVV
ncbi:hypothetical protein BC936DRAFT_136947 [Jimgerdemannia flammicorona]|uniref:Arrestin C-terminal-like domain-containing protein n=1 Tax=Jimgerdemannia flammicorona TaxID=994334 RepID=A0A433DJA7_9FUNG|nr:hypothetical protein BC936DRAFT_136947 [Jimgerdemannia flammicorona]